MVLGIIRERWTEGAEGTLNIALGCLASCAFSCLDFSDFEAELLSCWGSTKYSNFTREREKKYRKALFPELEMKSESILCHFVCIFHIIVLYGY